MNYQQSLAYVTGVHLFGSKKNGLENSKALLALLGNPERRFASVHVAGTNGKGSTCAFLESILRATGLRTGLYTSPYLERFTERIRMGGQQIPEDDFARIATQVRAAADELVARGQDQPTFFELVTACCFLYYAQQNVDIAVIETGMGGRLDATNVLRPVLCAITSIGMDHTRILGDTLEKIAAEKAGILKSGVPCVLAAGNTPGVTQVLRTQAQALGSPLIDAATYTLTPGAATLAGQTFSLRGGALDMRDAHIALLGEHQIRNAATAAIAADALRTQGYAVDDAAIRTGLAATRWAGRMEVLGTDPLFVIDGAHNPQGMDALAQAVRRHLGDRPICAVVGALRDKDYTHMADSVCAFAHTIIATEPDSPRAVDAHTLAALFAGCDRPVQCLPDQHAAFATALRSGQSVVVAGSLYLAGAARSWYLLSHNV